MSSERRRRGRRRAAPLLLLALVGCGRPAGTLFEAPAAPLRWPPPPQPARIEYVGQLVTDQDLKPGRSFGKAIGETLFGAEPAQSMLSPYGLCTDGGDRLFVSDSNAHVIHVFDLGTRRYERWPPDPTPADAESMFAQPLGLAWHPRGRLLVADGAGGRIAVLDADGRLLDTIGGGILDRPSGVAVDATGQIFVADAAAHAVLVFDADGRLQQRVGGRGVEPGRFNFPTNVAAGGGHLYVSDTLNFRVQVFDERLNPIRIVGGHGDLPGYFSQPKGIGLDRDGHLYVVDAHFESVQIFDDEGHLLLSFGREGHEAGQFWLPAGIHLDSSNRIWIADSYNRRVQVFRYLGDSP